MLHARNIRDPARHAALYGAGARDARGHAKSPHGGLDGDRDLQGRCADLRPWLRDCRDRRRRAVADRQCQPQSRPELYHRLLHGGGVRRRRQSRGYAGGCLYARRRQQVPRAGRRGRARQDRHSRANHSVHSETSARPVRAQGTSGGSMIPHLLTRSLDRAATVFIFVVAACGILIPLSNLLLPAGSFLQVPTYLVALWGKYVCYAILALAIDLIWGYCGILSLGDGAFFALGGYAMGMSLMRLIGPRGVYGNPILPDFMVFLNYPKLPWYWNGFDMFWFAGLMILLVPGLLAFCFGWLALRSRVTGVYLSIITQAMTYALLLAFFRNDFGFGGNNGLTDFKDILGFNVQADGTRAVLFALSCVALIIGFLICRAVVTSKLGKVLSAIRDAESRTRFLGYRVESYKLFVFTLSACMAGVAGALYVPQVGIINPGEFAPGNSIEAVIWVAVGGRGTLIGAALGAVVVNYAKTVFTSGPLAPYWLFMLGALFILVTLLLPRGIIGTFNAWWEPWKAQRLPALAESAARVDGVTDLTRLDETRIAELGIGRKFQKPTVFESQTIEDNLLLALNVDHSVKGTLFWRESKPETERIERVLETIRLKDSRNRLAGSLSHGQKQWLEIGMLLAQDPKLLLVDEPVAGMTDVKTHQTAELLKEINKEKTVMVVEHDMTFVRELGVKVTCLHEGTVLAEGTIDKVSSNERVIEVYLGR